MSTVAPTPETSSATAMEANRTALSNNTRPLRSAPKMNLFNPMPTSLEAGKRVSSRTNIPQSARNPTSRNGGSKVQVKLDPKAEPNDHPVVKLEEDLGDYEEYSIISHKSSDGSIHCLMRFKPSNPEESVQLFQMAQPLRMNRKNPRIQKPEGEAMDVDLKEPKWRQLKGVDGKPIIGRDGKPAMGATVDGKEMTVAQWHKYVERKKEGDRKPTKAELEAGKGKKGNAKGGAKPFNAKTRQVFTANPLSKHDPQERFPWVLESADDAHSWTGKKQARDDASAYGILVATSATKTMAFIPIAKHFDFVPTKRHAASKTAETAEAELEDFRKRGNIVYQMNTRSSGGASAATIATIGEASGSKGRGPKKGGVKKEEVDDDAGGLFGSDDEGPSRREKGDGGSMDEVEYDEDMADDDEGVPEELEDDHTKENNARIKKMQIAANKTVDGRVDDDNDDDDDEQKLNKDGRRVKRALKKQGMYGDSDSDEDKNPYASDEEEEEEEDFFFGTSEQPQEADTASAATSTAEAASGSKADSKSGSRSSTPVPTSASVKTTNTANTTSPSKGKNKSKSSTPMPGAASSSTSSVPIVQSASTSSLAASKNNQSRASSPGVSAATLLAQRATSPVPKGKKGGASRGASPIVGNGLNRGGRATSPLAAGGSRAGSPVPDYSLASSVSGGGVAVPSRGHTNAASSVGSPLKRKMMDDAPSASSSVASGSSGGEASGAGTNPARKKGKKNNGAPSTPKPPVSLNFPGAITEAEVIQVLRGYPQGIMSGDLVSQFKPRFAVNNDNKEVLRVLAKKVTINEQLPDGKYRLMLKQEYR